MSSQQQTSAHSHSHSHSAAAPSPSHSQSQDRSDAASVASTSSLSSRTGLLKSKTRRQDISLSPSSKERGETQPPQELKMNLLRNQVQMRY